MADPMVEILDVKNDLSEVGRANDALRELWVRCTLPDEFEMPVTLCLEEVLSNVIRHGCQPGQQCDIQVRYTLVAGGIEVEVSDDAQAFDPLSLPPPNLTAPLEQRKPGGLGVLLVRKMMDEVCYEYRDGRNHLLFRKYWPAAAAESA